MHIYRASQQGINALRSREAITYCAVAIEKKSSLQNRRARPQQKFGWQQKHKNYILYHICCIEYEVLNELFCYC